VKRITKKKKVKKRRKVKVKKIKKVDVSPRDVERIWKKLGKLEERWSKSWKKIDKINDNVRDLISETRVIKMLQSDTDKVWGFTHELNQNLRKMNSRLDSLTRKNAQMLQTFEDEIKATHTRMNKFDDDLKSVRKLPKFYQKINEKVAELEKQYNVIASDYTEKVKDIEEVVKPEKEKLEKITDLDTVRDQVEGIRKSMLTFNKLWADYKREIDDRLGLRPTPTMPTATPISPGVQEELESLRDIVNKMSLENEQLKKMARDIRVTQMGTPNTEIMTNLTSRINTVEKKITEVEEELSKFGKTKPIVME